MGRWGEWANGRMGEWANGRWANGRMGRQDESIYRSVILVVNPERVPGL